MTAAAQSAEVDRANWLEDSSCPLTADWIRDQRGRTSDHLASLPRPKWIEELLGQVGREETKAVRRHGPWSLWQERGGATRPHDRIVGRRDGGQHRVIHDAGADESTTLTTWSASPDGSWLAAMVAVAGAERRTPLHLISLADDRPVSVVEEVRHTSLCWADNDTLIYLRHRTAGPVVVKRAMRSGTEDILLTGPAPGWDGQLRLWHGRWLTIVMRAGASSRTVVYWIDLAAPGPPEVRTVQPQPDAATVAIVDTTGRLTLLTNHDAPHGRLVRPGPTPSDRSTWTTVLTGSAAAALTAADIVVLDGRTCFAVVYKAATGTSVALHDCHDLSRLGDLELPGPGPLTVRAAMDGSGRLVLRYTDWVTPSVELDIDLARRRLRIARHGPAPEPEVRTVSGHATSPDGTQVPYLLLEPTHTDRPLPTILTVYGGFGRSIEPAYHADNLAWVRAGGAVVVADVRGGGGRGTDWHLSAVREGKQRSIDDLIAVATALHDSGRTTSGQLALLGASHGGLLVTAALVQRPDLFAASVAVAPLTDMAAYETSGLGAAWLEEFGSMENPTERAALLAYSPCHTVRRGTQYPPLLLLTGGNDTRVDPSHARKLALLLQQADPRGGPFLLHELPDGGHNRGSIAQATLMASMTLRFLAAHSGLSAVGGGHVHAQKNVPIDRPTATGRHEESR